MSRVSDRTLILELRRRVEALEKDSHQPIDLFPRVVEILRQYFPGAGILEDTGPAVTAEFLPCPFCGTFPTLSSLHLADGTSWVACPSSRCSAEGPSARTSEGARTAWNSRIGPGVRVARKDVSA